jgi:hypothetical protein
MSLHQCKIAMELAITAVELVITAVELGTQVLLSRSTQISFN